MDKKIDDNFSKTQNAKTSLKDNSTDNLAKPRPIKKSLIALVVIVTIVAVGSIALAVWFAISINSPAKQTDSSDPSLATKFKSSTELLSKATFGMSGSTIVSEISDGLGGRTSDGYIIYNTPAIKQDGGYKFLNLPLESTGAGYASDSAAAYSNYQKLESFFKENGFVLRTTSSDFEGSITLNGKKATTVSLAVYASDDTACLIQQIDATSTPIGNYLTSIGCGAASSYLAAAKALSPLYSAYTKEAKSSPYIVLGFIGSGKGNDGYENVTLYQENPEEREGDFQAAYYKKSSDSDWSYFKSFIGNPLCTDFTNDTLRKAFAGRTCIDSSDSLSTVSS